ncbi:MAG TPA: YkgJ family cysteine cluster protein [Bryobacteraceae bacterium]|nr:YkgJ family cysteine cluster protein [Bryobacteraceae bacterium]
MTDPLQQRVIERGDRLLLRVLSDSLQEAARRAGPRLACRIGCTECCIGPFPITLLDAWRLRRALRELASRDPNRAARIRLRASDSLARLAPSFPGDPRSGLLSPDPRAEEEFASRHEGEPCPLLDPRTGACELYEARPVSCRTFGPPVRLGQEDLPPCRLCFQGTPAAEVEACRVAMDPDGIEDAVLAELETACGARGETIVAFALALEHFVTDTVAEDRPAACPAR